LLNKHAQGPQEEKLPESLHIWKIRAYSQQCKNDITLNVKVVRVSDVKRVISGQQEDEK